MIRIKNTDMISNALLAKTQTDTTLIQVALIKYKYKHVRQPTQCYNVTLKLTFVFYDTGASFEFSTFFFSLKVFPRASRGNPSHSVTRHTQSWDQTSHKHLLPAAAKYLKNLN